MVAMFAWFAIDFSMVTLFDEALVAHQLLLSWAIFIAIIMTHNFISVSMLWNLFLFKAPK